MNDIVRIFSYSFLWVFFLNACTIDSSPNDSWGPLVELRDNTNTWAVGKPDEGWWVTPIHATLLSNGNVLVTGWSRRDKSECKPGGTRKNGVSFILNPRELTESSFHITPLDEQGSQESDVLYCAGHGFLSDGRILFAGGASYEDLGLPTEIEVGLNYARIFHQNPSSFSRVESPMQGGPKEKKGVRWYPTVTNLPDDRILVTGGFVGYGKQDANLSVETFDYQKFDKGAHPWELLVSHDQAPLELTPGQLDYPHVHVLHQPGLLKNLYNGSYSIAIIGGSGRLLLFSYLDHVPSLQRFAQPPGGKRTGGAQGATSALLPTGEILVMGGNWDSTTSQRADLYDPYTDSWEHFDTGIGRDHPSSVLLPDGKVLIVNGGGKQGFQGDRRQPQILDPVTRQMTSQPPWTDDPSERGYHNIGILLKDARVLVGGGISATVSRIGCERPDVRIYSPPYLFQNPRPSLSNVQEPISMRVAGDQVTLTFVKGPLRADTGVVLMALGSTTHSFDQNQRYVPLTFKSLATGTIQVSPPKDYFQAPAGDYILFLVNDLGIPSEGKHVQLK